MTFTKGLNSRLTRNILSFIKMYLFRYIRTVLPTHMLEAERGIDLTSTVSSTSFTSIYTMLNSRSLVRSYFVTYITCVDNTLYYVSMILFFIRLTKNGVVFQFIMCVVGCRRIGFCIQKKENGHSTVAFLENVKILLYVI